MKLSRLSKLFTTPFRMLFASLYPVAYAKNLGVRMNGHVVIYGSSYGMFSAEPYLVTLGDNVYISVGASFVCHDGATLPFRKIDPTLDVAAEIKVGNDVFIGAGAVLLPVVSIGNNCIVGAHAIVTRDVPDGCIVAGSPARIVGSWSAYLEKARRKSLGIGHLSGREKVLAYKAIFKK